MSFIEDMMLWVNSYLERHTIHQKISCSDGYAPFVGASSKEHMKNRTRNSLA
jgi:hypothetical protein